MSGRRSPRKMKAVCTFEDAVKRAASPKRTARSKSPKRTTRKSPSGRKRQPTEFAKFFKKMNKNNPELDGLSGAERMKIIGKMWRDEK